MSNEETANLQEELDAENTIKEEYKLWRENCRFMYEFVSETALKWPSITVQWLPGHHKDDSNGLYESSLLLGTHTSGEDINFLKVASTQLPITKTEDSKVNSRIKITKKFKNNSEINRARYMSQDPNTVATINGMGEVDIYKLDSPTKESVHHLTHHTDNGYGLSWNTFKRGYLATGADDKKVQVIEIAGERVTTIIKLEDHNDIVNDVKWHPFNENLLGSVSDDKHFKIFDIRTSSKPVLEFYGDESKGINTLSFSPFSSNLISIGNASSTINLLDFRQLSSEKGQSSGLLHTMMGHSDAITSIEFSPHVDGIIASGSQDRRDAEDGCPELFMMHAGHTGGVTDLNWCPYKDWTLASVADDNIVHVWEISKTLLISEATEEVESNELE
ncbi:hypothetical protein CANTEDRAFT_116503 [Yamadazyma tenuis ATCC 10573]|uniref:Histone acetyltransferase subunit n=1 Tax=Candida tenuis (strain ATCC 10573 / BCRC 21748 / CBS 615 / JCM 9827 / NBRC 10315 / NRRL Y-1498 / VKM Y-70) TaxID=590646 RepID=G3BE42_CANTC|nr:histone acetyltransferase subunit [Yamadazyma tenuis ATCC 10573]XP_006690363.1 uncharacterized protein CANTEDRAFT_116503 [Yamadazyma tenuis ATCC 10573]EGV61148.1 histone acetyltransferase subunit [Yamadazyma tenuis ATCC 10573]EGV61149.1 hypothetical protein CANTEDRAFT_116503 [Yamadazyma tenuis ATCC 10573]